MATKNKRGPAVGGAKSLWNYTTSPRWSREETRILELCLMKYGIGQWSTISSTGLLPGKVNGQLSGHTQRLLGQQSLEAFSGLCVDVEKIRRDNAAKTNVMRKGGLIIHTGGRLSQEEKEERKMLAQEMYGLTEEKKREVDREIEQLFAKCLERNVEPESVGKDTAELSSNELQRSDLMHADVACMERERKVELLQALRTELKRLYEQCGDPGDSKKPICKKKATKERTISRKRSSQTKPEAPRQLKKTRREGKGKFRLAEEMEGTTKVDPVAVETVIEMGYSKRHAVDALVENDNNIEAAVQWLILNCR